MQKVEALGKNYQFSNEYQTLCDFATQAQELAMLNRKVYRGLETASPSFEIDSEQILKEVLNYQKLEKQTFHDITDAQLLLLADNISTLCEKYVNILVSITCSSE